MKKSARLRMEDFLHSVSIAVLLAADPGDVAASANDECAGTAISEARTTTGYLNRGNIHLPENEIAAFEKRTRLGYFQV